MIQLRGLIRTKVKRQLHFTTVPPFNFFLFECSFLRAKLTQRLSCRGGAISIKQRRTIMMRNTLPPLASDDLLGRVGQSRGYGKSSAPKRNQKAVQYCDLIGVIFRDIVSPAIGIDTASATLARSVNQIVFALGKRKIIALSLRTLGIGVCHD